MAAPSPEAFSRVRYIYDSLTPKPDELLQRGRYYIREGPLMVWDENRRKKSKRYIFLLNDVLLITKRDGKSKYWLRIFITLRSPYVEVENISSGFESAFRLAVKTRSFVFFSEGEVDSWVEDITRCIKMGREGNESGNGLEEPRRPAGTQIGTSVMRNPTRGSDQDFSFFTDGDYVETKVNFDSGVKLGAIRSDRGSGDDTPIPVLAPPPRRSSSISNVPNTFQQPTSSHQITVVSQPTQPAQPANAFGGFGAPTSTAPATTARPASTSGSGTSLADFLGLTPTIQPTTTQPVNPYASPAHQPAPTQTTSFDFFAPNSGFGSVAPKPVAPAPAATNPYQTPSNPYSAPSGTGYGAPLTTNPQSTPFGMSNQSYGYQAQPASTTSSNPFGSFSSTTSTQNSSYGAFGAPQAQPATQDPFAALWAAPPAQTQQKTPNLF